MVKAPSQNTKTPLIDSFGKDLTQLAREGKLDPIVGREAEIKRCSRILSRRKKNNPLLIGEPGVGKTAIVEGLASMIVDRTCPRVLFGKRIVCLELANLVAGTKYRGEFEQRMEQIISEVYQNGNIILFIDEIHSIVGAGSASGSLDAANILKPALARGEIQCIGATTIDEYRSSIERDGALNRRFQQVLISPPSLEETREILENIKEKYEDHHSVRFTKEALDACVKLSDRYIQDRFLPDKAIDLMDEAGATVHIEGVVVPPNIRSLEDNLAKIHKNKADAVNSQQYETAAKLRDDALIVMDQISKAKKEWETTLKENRLTVTEDDISSLVSAVTGIPTNKMSEADLAKLSIMEDFLKARVIGQDQAVSKLTRAIKRARAGLKNKRRPIGTFLFTGKSGVGKSELAKQLAIFLFGTEDSLIRIDMSEYGERFTTSRLTGAPPGYIGYEDGGLLTEKIRRKPYSVVLLDEIEKADPSIFNILLQVLDDGRLTDSHGKVADFKNSIIVMTSNVGIKTLQEFGTGVGFNTMSTISKEKEMQDAVVAKAVSKQFPPEFINRIDDIITFNSLGKNEIKQILEIELVDLAKRITEAGYTVIVENSAKDFLIEKGHDDKFGARPLKRIVQSELEDLIAEAYVDGKIKIGDRVTVIHQEKAEHLTIDCVTSSDTVSPILQEVALIKN